MIPVSAIARSSIDRVEPDFDKVEPEAVYCFSRIDGVSTHYAHGDDLFFDFLGGNQPVFERGVNLEAIMNDGTEEYALLRSKASSRTIDLERLRRWYEKGW